MIEKEKRARFKLFLYISTLLIIMIFGLAVVVTEAADPAVCSFCHADSPSIESWTRSSHGSVACAVCHVRRGLEGVASPSIWHFALYFNPNKNPADPKALSHQSWTAVDGNVCLRCHSPKIRRFTFQRGLRMNHTRHLENNLECPTCHNLIGHPLKEPQGFFVREDQDRIDHLNMVNGCWRCHGMNSFFLDEELLAELPADADPPTACTACHSTLWSIRPQSGRISHRIEDGVAWGSGTLRHGKIAGDIDYQLCFGCHDRQVWCGDKCHNEIAMPHNIPKYEGRFASAVEPDWRRVHYVKAAKGEEACDLCHNSRWLDEPNDDYCMTCHHQEFYDSNPSLGKPWIDVSMKYVEEKGSTECEKCHRLEFCVACHSTGRKAPPGTTFIRGGFDN